MPKALPHVLPQGWFERSPWCSEGKVYTDGSSICTLGRITWVALDARVPANYGIHRCCHRLIGSPIRFLLQRIVSCTNSKLGLQTAPVFRALSALSSCGRMITASARSLKHALRGP
jgi:hypothetical protein